MISMDAAHRVTAVMVLFGIVVYGFAGLLSPGVVHILHGTLVIGGLLTGLIAIAAFATEFISVWRGDQRKP